MKWRHWGPLEKRHAAADLDSSERAQSLNFSFTCPRPATPEGYPHRSQWGQTNSEGGAKDESQCFFWFRRRGQWLLRIVLRGLGAGAEPLLGGMFGAFQPLLMGMMSSLMGMMRSGLMGQVLNPTQGGLALPANSMFGSRGGAPSFGDAARRFMGGGSASSTSENGSRKRSKGSAARASEVGAATGKLVSRAGGKMDASIAKNFDSMVAAAKKDGVSLQINSAHRSRAEQERLYAAYKNGTGNLAARPGTSNHEKGQAIDFKSTSGAYSWLAKNAQRFGFKNLPGEPWHYSPTGN